MAATPRKGETSRERVRRLATGLFAKHGYHGTSIQDVTEAAGLGRGALYYHIKSKEDLLYQVIRAPLLEMVEYARAALDSTGDPEERLQALARTHLENLLRYREAWTVTVHDSRALSGDSAREIRALRQEYERLWQQLLAECHDAGLIEQVDLVRIRGILGMFNHSYPWLRSRGAESPDRVARSFLEMIFDGLRITPTLESPREFTQGR
jgi:TetR/AcrR family transcriptional regulator, cholesterol catabolism regulator